jgi:DEAD/DEAH box helicase domain-containing protein
VQAVDVDYYTDANLAVTLHVLDVLNEEPLAAALATRHLGEVLTTAMATIFKKIKLHTHENLGWGKIQLPEEQMHTTAYWLSLGPAALHGMSPSETEGALLGFGNLLAHMAPVFLMCDPRDVRPVVQVRAPFTEQPTVYLYDVYPGGTGLADKLYTSDTDIMAAALDLVSRCPCDHGCPACVGPPAEVGETTKALAETLLQRLTAAAVASEPDLTGA